MHPQTLKPSEKTHKNHIFLSDIFIRVFTPMFNRDHLVSQLSIQTGKHIISPLQSIMQ